MDKLKIYIDRLFNGQVFEQTLEVSPEVFEVSEPDLSFSNPISLHCKSYLAEDHLIVNLDATTLATVPCAICNKMISIPLKVEGAYLALPLEEIPHNIYNYGPFLRESLLLELPFFAECEGSCKDRKEVEKFFKKSEKKSEATNFPFSNLE